MGKKKTSLPSLQGVTTLELLEGHMPSLEESEPIVEVEAEVEVVDPVIEFEVEVRAVEVPLGPKTPGFVPRRVDVKSLTQSQRDSMQRLTNGLIQRASTLEDGTIVKNSQHAIKWILENI